MTKAIDEIMRSAEVFIDEIDSIYALLSDDEKRAVDMLYVNFVIRSHEIGVIPALYSCLQVKEREMIMSGHNEVIIAITIAGLTKWLLCKHLLNGGYTPDEVSS